MAGARPIVDPPAVSALPFGLWDAVQQLSPVPSHWQQGITWVERCPVGDTTYDECISVTGTGYPPTPVPKTDNVLQTFRGATPFTVFAEFDCSPVGSLTDIELAATSALARVEPTQASMAFWTGSVGGQLVAFPHLAADAEVADDQEIVLQTAASVVVTGTDVAHALGELEAELALCYNGVGVVHVPLLALPTFVAWNLVVERDGGLWTTSGNRVIVGPGYTGTGPDGTAAPAGTAWVYATGQVFGMRSPDVFATRLPESFDRAENTVKMIAERTYVLAFECCHIATLINLGVPED